MSALKGCETPVCDFCIHYEFNGNESGAYTGHGRCEHPEHPGPRDPADGCDDFKCELCAKKDAA